MAVELTVPQVGESIAEVQIGQWLKNEGDPVAAGDILVEIETDKVTVELPAPSAGTISKLLKRGGDKAQVGEVIGYLEEGGAPAEPAPAAAPQAPPAAGPPAPQRAGAAAEAKGRAPAATPRKDGGPAKDVGPAVAKAPAPGRGTQGPTAPPEQKPAVPAAAAPDSAPAPAAPPARKSPEPQPPMAPAELSDASPEQDLSRPEAPAHPVPSQPGADRAEQVVPMSPLRRRIAERLLQAQQNAALLTTFNEVDMSAVMSLRARHQEAFAQKHQTKLGIMSFFVKAAIDALKQYPQINAEIRGTDIIFRDYYDIGVAVSTNKGLVVPVLRNAERMSFGEIERAIADFANRARDNKLKLPDLEGGTFTITNGGVFGSLLSTPIINPPQSGILGLHAIQDRPVARDGQVVIRPMMYLALTYDHRIVDGREAVTYLRRIKEVIEEPARMLVEI